VVTVFGQVAAPARRATTTAQERARVDHGADPELRDSLAEATSES
jgi:hypothetical protein